MAKPGESLPRQRGAESDIWSGDSVEKKLAGSMGEVLVSGVRSDTALTAAVHEEL